MTEITYWHEMPSNFSNGTSIEGIGTYVQYIASVTNGAIGPLILFLSAMISFFALKGYGTAKAGGAASIFTTIISVFLWRLDLIPLWIVMTLVGVTVGLILMVKGEADKGV